jgi:4-amino-4-deoxy-L-arabinose transferase-like glycosyltransferase
VPVNPLAAESLERADGEKDRERGRRRGMASLAALVGLALAVVVAVDPRGRFPLNDDWCYAEAVRNLLTLGEVRLVDWGSPALLTQLLWGAGFAAIWGFSFDVLRASTLVLGLVALLSLRGVMRELRAGPVLATFAAIALLATPLFVLLGHTFMTDVPFLGFSLASLWLLLRGLERDSRAATWCGLLLAVAATFVRQLGLALLVGFAVATLVRGWRRPRQWLIAWAPLAAGFALLKIYEAWLASRGTLPGAFRMQWMTIAQRLDVSRFDFLVFALTNAWRIGIEVGLFAAPLAAIWLLQSRSANGRRRLIVIGAASLATLLIAWRGRLVPYFSNLVLDIGCSAPRQAVGPLTIRDGCLTPEPGLGLLRFAPRVALTWIGLVALGCVLVAAFEAWRCSGTTRNAGAALADAPRRSSIALVLGTAASYWVVVSSIDVFDRYLLFLVPFALVALAASMRAQPAPTRTLSWVVGGALALGSLLWSVGAVQEYLDWNRARWRAITYLARDLGAGREQIDGGFEYGGWLNFDARFRHDRRGSSWWWVVEDRYAVAFAPIQGYEVLRRFPYRGWFGLVEDDIVALERSTGAASLLASPAPPDPPAMPESRPRR